MFRRPLTAIAQEIGAQRRLGAAIAAAAVRSAAPPALASSSSFSSRLSSPASSYPSSHSSYLSSLSPSSASIAQHRHRLGPHLNDRTPNDRASNRVSHLLEEKGLQALIFPEPSAPSTSATSSPSSAAPLISLQQHDRIAPLLSSFEHLYPLALPRPSPSPSHRKMQSTAPQPAAERFPDESSLVPYPSSSPPRTLSTTPTPLFLPKEIPPLSLMELIHRVTAELSSPQSDLNAVHALMTAYDSSLGEWQRFAMWDEGKRYTRNLIATDYSTFTLMLLCWNPRLGSPVHNHASSECFMKVIQGQVVESQYFNQQQQADAPEAASAVAAAVAAAVSASSSSPSSSPSSSSSSFSSLSSPLRLRRRLVAFAGSVLFINDSIGLHKIDNPFEQPAVTLHCYIPPYDSCKCYEEDTGAVKESYVSFHSEHGERVDMHA